MRTYILTKKEREVIKSYLEVDETSDAFYVLLNRINKDLSNLESDIDLIQQVLEKYESK